MAMVATECDIVLCWSRMSLVAFPILWQYLKTLRNRQVMAMSCPLSIQAAKGAGREHKLGVRQNQNKKKAG